MKKNFFGYNVSEVDIAVNALREENESLNSTIASLKAHLKNTETSTNAKANLLEDDLRKTESNIMQLREENENLISQMNVFTQESEALKRQNTDLKTRIENSDLRNEDLLNQIANLNLQLEEMIEQSKKIDSSKIDELQAQIVIEKEHSSSLEKELNDKVEELHNTKEAFDVLTKELEDANNLKAQLDSVYSENAKQAEKLLQLETRLGDYKNIREKLTSSQITLNEKIIELDNSLKENKKLREELVVAQASIEEQDKVKALEMKQIANLNHAADISFQAYHDMSVMRNEVIEYIHGYMKEHFQRANENNIKIRSAIEQRQVEFNQMLRELFVKASDFRMSLSNVDSEYEDISDFNFNVDTISARMNEIMDQFMEESETKLKKKTEILKPKEISSSDEKDADLIDGEGILKKSKVQEFPFVKGERQNSL